MGGFSSVAEDLFAVCQPKCDDSDRCTDQEIQTQCGFQYLRNNFLENISQQCKDTIKTCADEACVERQIWKCLNQANQSALNCTGGTSEEINRNSNGGTDGTTGILAGRCFSADPTTDAECAARYPTTTPMYDSSKSTKCRARWESDCAGTANPVFENGRCRARVQADCTDDKPVLETLTAPQVVQNAEKAAEKAAKDYCTNTWGTCQEIDWAASEDSYGYGFNNNHVFKIVNGQFAEGAAKAYLGCFHDDKYSNERALCPDGAGECTAETVSRVPSIGPGKCLEVCLANANITNNNLKYIGLQSDGECFCSTNPDPKTGFAKFCEQKNPTGWQQFIAAAGAAAPATGCS
jgi:hypothetical protein